ncbi:hypothetical protein ACUYFE_08055 [Olegusella massiliensis]|uniref:hypothetical protein n=1 Tax=Olegusella massiliensis TaxID=1776381 RepID=UPI0040554836
MISLKPCPFCGGTTQRVNVANAERTCRVSAEIVEHEPTITAMGLVCFRCDQCDWVWYMGDLCCYPDKPNYCPNCGARVVSCND